MLVSTNRSSVTHADRLAMAAWAVWSVVALVFAFGLLAAAYGPEPPHVYTTGWHHVIPAVLGVSWAGVLVALFGPKTLAEKIAVLVMGVLLAVVLGLWTLVLSELLSPLALAPLVVLRALEAVATVALGRAWHAREPGRAAPVTASR